MENDLIQKFFDMAQEGYQKIGWPAEVFLSALLIVGMAFFVLALLPFMAIGMCMRIVGNRRMVT